MRSTLLIGLSSVAFLLVLGFVVPCLVRAGTPSSDYKVLTPIRHGNLTIFPVVATRSYSTQEFLTLDEGLHSGEVIVTESGSISPMVRPRGNHTPIPRHDGAQVNQLVLVNN